MKGNQESIAETIEDNVRSKILKEQLTDPAYFAKMSALLAWRGGEGADVKQAMFDVLKDIKEVNRLHPIVFAQMEY